MYRQTQSTEQKGGTVLSLTTKNRRYPFRFPPRRNNKTVRRVLRLLTRSRYIRNAKVHFPDNKVVLLPHGGDFFPALFQAMAEARSSICAEFYIIRNDATGTSFAHALMEAAARGLQVALIYDFIGCLETPDNYFQQLRDNGVHCLSFNKPAFSRLGLLDVRNHRKMVVIDGSTAFVGSLNVGDEYAGYGDSYQHWRDTGIRLDGLAAGQLRRLFRRTWVREGGGKIPRPPSRPSVQMPMGDAGVVIVHGTPHHARSVIGSSFRLAMAGAIRNITIMTPYFVPGPRVSRSLLRAVRNDIKVQLILPSVSDLPWVQLATRAYLAPLLNAGVEIFERQGTILHAKVMLIDDCWVMVGSANLNYRSFHRNHENNVIIDSREFGAEVQAMFVEDLRQSRRITVAEYERRTLLQRLLQWLFSPISRFL